MMSPDPFPLFPEVSRGMFLRGSLKLFALTSIGMGASACAPAGLPALRGLSAQQYLNMNAIAEVFLAGNPIPDFDLGLAFDDYLFGKASPLPQPALDKALELADVPSSILAALVLDGSLTTLVQLDPAKREARMLAWQQSDSVLKRGLFNIMRSTCFFMLSNRREWNAYCGYPV